MSITVHSNGNSPEIKLFGGMMVDTQNDLLTAAAQTVESTTKTNYEISRNKNLNTTLSINERYRRLIPYMTFCCANDLVVPTTDKYKTDTIEVEKAQIIEAQQNDHNAQRDGKKIVYTSYRNIPRYQGNRLTQHNIASSYPTKLIYKPVASIHEVPSKVMNYKSPVSDYNIFPNTDHSGKFIHKQFPKSNTPFVSSTRKPHISHYNENENIRYYIPEKEHVPKYKLIPYEQTPPVEVENNYKTPSNLIPVPVLVHKDQVYIKPRPMYVYDTVNTEKVNLKKQPVTISENYFENQHPQTLLRQPVIESGFKPIIHETIFTTEAPTFTSTPRELYHYKNHKPEAVHIQREPLTSIDDYNSEYFQYAVEQPTYVPKKTPNMLSLTSLLNSLQLNKSIPKPITRENVGPSIRILLQVLNTLKAVPHHSEVEAPVLSTPKPFIAAETIKATPKPEVTAVPILDDDDLNSEHYVPPSQHLDDYPNTGGSSQRFPLPISSDDEGGTPGRPGIDYPILTIIPETSFNCKTQRYKGFFADTETRCQVWHYCDLNGGQASFLCPNGTIFSQAALTCDWWFNVRCNSTMQLYVLNESLYKYILPHSPKFPEDYSGPLVDKYLTLKFKEMEEQFKKNKNKKATNDTDDEDSIGNSDGTEGPKHVERSAASAVGQPSVIIESPGTSGNVERLHD